jgi:hypothetical protein
MGSIIQDFMNSLFAVKKKVFGQAAPHFRNRLIMGTFRKFLFILYSRRPRGRLLVNQKRIGITDP